VRYLSISIVTAAIVCGSALAQNTESGAVRISDGPVPVPQDSGTFPGDLNNAVQINGRTVHIMGGIPGFGVMGQPVKGAPYSADGTTEFTQTLSDGTHIDRKETYTIYRDSEGRIRRESGDQAWISDPVAGATYILDTQQQTARKLPLKGADMAYKKMQVETRAAKPVGGGGFALAAAPGGQVFFDGRVMSAHPQPKNESLGTQEMEGVEAQGTRTTVDIPQGQIGNDRPLQMVTERWFSPELQITVMSKHTDPMTGNFVEQLTNIRRGEPDPSLFQVPADYTVPSDK